LDIEARRRIPKRVKKVGFPQPPDIGNSPGNCQDRDLTGCFATLEEQVAA
jgi:hypothetical protein